MGILRGRKRTKALLGSESGDARRREGSGSGWWALRRLKSEEGSEMRNGLSLSLWFSSPSDIWVEGGGVRELD